MPKEVNPRIHVNEKDFPHTDYHCDDPVKERLVKKLAVMITDNIPRKLPGGLHENHMDFWILDRLLSKREIRFMLSLILLHFTMFHFLIIYKIVPCYHHMFHH